MAHENVEAGVRAAAGEPGGGCGASGDGRIAALEREVRQLRRTNEVLRVYVARELDLDLDLDLAAAAWHPGTDPGNPGTDSCPDSCPDAGTDAGIGDAGVDTRPDAGPGAGPGAGRGGVAGSGVWAAAGGVAAGGVGGGWLPEAVSGGSPGVVGSPARPLVAFRALGPIEAVVGGRLVDLGAPKQRALLALLVSKVGQPVGVDMIVEELWAGSPPRSAIASLQAYVANLRRVLEPGRAPRTAPSVLRTYERGYLLERRVVEVDVDAFSRRAVAGWQALDAGDPQVAVHEFESALGLWRGRAYAEVADTACVRPDVARLEELRLSVVEGRCTGLLAAGAHEIAVAELEAFVQAHPLREYGCELLSLALYRAGRQADALAVLRTNQRRLAEELGIDPRPALQLLERQILNQAPSLDWRPATGTARPHAAWPGRGTGTGTGARGLRHPGPRQETGTRHLSART